MKFYHYELPLVSHDINRTQMTGSAFITRSKSHFFMVIVAMD